MALISWQPQNILLGQNIVKRVSIKFSMFELKHLGYLVWTG